MLDEREAKDRKNSREKCEGVNSAKTRLLTPGKVDHVAHPGGARDQEDWGKRTQLDNDNDINEHKYDQKIFQKEASWEFPIAIIST